MKSEVYKIEGMSCAACSSAVERVTRRIEGVAESNVNLMTEKLSVTYDEGKTAPEAIIAAVTKAGFGISPEKAEKKTEVKKTVKDELLSEKITLIVCIVLCAVELYVSMGQMLFANLPIPDIISMHTHPMNFAVIQLVLTMPVLLLGKKFFIGGYSALFRLHPNMDSLVALGCSASFLFSLAMTFMIGDSPHSVHNLYYESASVVLTLIMLGKYAEHKAVGKTKSAISKLIELTPDKAVKIIDGQEITVDTQSLSAGDIVVVKAGEKIPLDSVVIDGTSSVDESMLTGESIPVEKEAGNKTIGGSINRNGVLYLKITETGENTVLSKIIRYVEEAQSKKAPVSKLADKVAEIFVPAVMTIAVVSAVVWLILDYDFSFALRVFTCVLIIACPCALGLATPSAIMVGTGLGASHGILLRSSEVLETTHKTNTVVFDKTGTLTLGKPTVTDVVSDDEENLLRSVITAETGSAHPLAQAVVEFAGNKVSDGEKAESFQNLTGMGVKATVGGETILVGNLGLMKENGIDIGGLSEQADRLSEQGKSIVFAARNGKALGLLAISDIVRPTAKETVEKLHSMGIKTVMITGDNKKAAEFTGGQIGIDEIYAQTLPRDKAEIIEKLRSGGNTVMMVGDGINDAPALAASDIGCAIGRGSDIAVESADIVLMRDDLRDVPRAVKLSRLTMRNIKQNLFWAFCYNTVGIPVAAGAFYWLSGILLSPMAAGLAMSLSSVCVVSNALRLRGKKL